MCDYGSFPPLWTYESTFLETYAFEDPFVAPLIYSFFANYCENDKTDGFSMCEYIAKYRFDDFKAYFRRCTGSSVVLAIE